MDFRKCVSPMCGGIYLSKVNRRAMRCPNGKYRRECYIGSPDWNEIGGNPFNGTETLLIQGAISKNNKKEIGDFGAIDVFGAYRGTAKSRKHTRLYGVKNNGLVCITSPCFSFDQSYLNTRFTRVLSGVDLSRAKADKKEVEWAQKLLANGEQLIASGYHRRTWGLGGRGLSFVAKNVYLPIHKKPITKLCPSGYSETMAGCATPHGCFFPDLELESIGGAAMLDPETGQLVAPITYSCVATCDKPAELVRPGKCQLALP